MRYGLVVVVSGGLCISGPQAASAASTTTIHSSATTTTIRSTASAVTQHSLAAAPRPSRASPVVSRSRGRPALGRLTARVAVRHSKVRAARPSRTILVTRDPWADGAKRSRPITIADRYQTRPAPRHFGAGSSTTHSMVRETVIHSSASTFTTASSSSADGSWMDESITRPSPDAYGPRFPVNNAYGPRNPVGFGGSSRWTEVSTNRSSFNTSIPRFSPIVGGARGMARANVMASCLVRTGDLDFGDYVASADLADDVQSEIRVTCSAGQSFNIALDAGRAIGATVASRSMTSRYGALPYILSTSPRRRAVWGDGSLSTSTMNVIGSGFPQSYTVFGRIEPGQFVAPGRYSDTFEITLSY